MIIVRITSGLGNQMYQYNFYRYLERLYPDTVVKADTTWLYQHDPHHGYELKKIFPNMRSGKYAMDETTVLDELKVTGLIPNRFRSAKLARKWVALVRPVNVLLKRTVSKNKIRNMLDDSTGEIAAKTVTLADGSCVDGMYDLISNLDPKKDYCIVAYWTSERYYGDRIDELKEEFAFDEPCDEENQRLLKQIDSENSVSIHIRRGDYLAAEYGGKFKLLGQEYYHRAIEYIRETVPNPRFYVFSDDTECAKNIMDGIDNTVFVTNNTGANSFRDMQLMSRCKHNIIANSTFSQWAGILNKNEGRLVIYPKDYMNGEDTEVKKAKGWVRL